MAKNGKAKKRKPPPPTIRRDRVKELRRVRAGDLIPNPDNYRTHPPEQRKAMDAALSEIGWADALIARETPEGLVLIDGHLRAETAPDDIVPVLVLDVDEKEARKLLLTLDPLAAMAEANGDMVRKLLASTDFDSEALSKLAASLVPELQKDGQTDPDAVPPVPKKPVSKRGDLWLLGEHRLLCGDSTSAEDVGRLMGGERAGLLLTDPPYGIGIVKEKRQKDGAIRKTVGYGGLAAVTPYEHITGDDKPFDPAHLLGLAPVAIIFGANHFASRLPESARWIVWDKGVSPTNDFSKAELAWVNTGGHVLLYRHVWSGMIRAGDRGVESKRLHPTQKPVGLLVQIAEDFPSDSVLDPYLGSGSTLIACEQLGRRCYACEIEPRYVDVAVKRWEDFTGRKAKRARK